jgi:hypothetical protein
MKVFIHRESTREYYAGHGQWVATSPQARDYLSSVKALAVAAQDQRAGVDIVLTFADARYTITLPTLTRKNNPSRALEVSERQK